MRASHPLVALVAVIALHVSPLALAWDDHSLMARPALAVLPEVRDAPPLRAESLDAFLRAEGPALAEVLARTEARAQASIPNYPPLPAALAYVADADETTRVRRFLESLRLNPEARQPLYVKAPHGAEVPAEGRIHWSAVTTLKDPGALGHAVLLGLEEGAEVPVIEVLASACDEPDYGFDLGVWEDNPTEWGPRYAMGTQPFGDRTKEFSSQAPLHMGFYHEAAIVYSLASFLGRTYPEMRIGQYAALARHAFATGHDYWGWRFAGWALHHVQDLTMPYHAQVLPGVGVTRMLWVNFLSMLGMPRGADNALRLVSNRHMTLEHYVREVLEEKVSAADRKHPFLGALADTSDDARLGSWIDAYPRETLTAETVARSRPVDRVLEKSVPRRLVSDPAYIVDETEPDINVLHAVRAEMSQGEQALDQAFTPLLRGFGAHSRVFVRTLRRDRDRP